MENIQTIDIVVAYHPNKPDEKYIPAKIECVGHGLKDRKPQKGFTRNAPKFEGLTQDETIEAATFLIERHGSDWFNERLNHGIDLKMRAQLTSSGCLYPKAERLTMSRLWILSSEDAPAELKASLFSVMPKGAAIEADFLEDVFSDDAFQDSIILFNEDANSTD